MKKQLSALLRAQSTALLTLTTEISVEGYHADHPNVKGWEHLAAARNNMQLVTQLLGMGRYKASVNRLSEALDHLSNAGCLTTESLPEEVAIYARAIIKGATDSTRTLMRICEDLAVEDLHHG